MGERHAYKLAAMEKTIAYPVEPGLFLSDLRVLLFLLLALAASLFGWLVRPAAWVKKALTSFSDKLPCSGRKTPGTNCSLALSLILHLPENFIVHHLPHIFVALGRFVAPSRPFTEASPFFSAGHGGHIFAEKDIW